MRKTILFDNKEFHFKIDDLPCLIHGKEKAGSSLFTISLIADLYFQGHKVLFLSGYPMARDELISQIGNQGFKISDKSSAIADLFDSPVIFVPREEVALFPELIEQLPDIKERVILIKNIDLFSVKDFSAVQNHHRLVISGDIDKCDFLDHLLRVNFATSVFFSEPRSYFEKDLPPLTKYEGYLKSKTMNGLVRIDLEKLRSIKSPD